MKGCGVVLSAFLPGGPIGPGEGDKNRKNVMFILSVII